MPERGAHWQEARKITTRVIVTGTLTLQTPAHLGNGEAVGPADMTLLRDPRSDTQALLTGTTIAGALRAHLRARLYGWGASPPPDAGIDTAVRLFGGRRGDDEGAQSCLIVDDARSTTVPVEVRDGVRIDARTGTAAEGAKFDMELLQAGTTFPLRFELLIPQDDTSGESASPCAFKRALALALQGLERGEIALGARKRRGFGRCRVSDWRVATYDLTTPEGLWAWLHRRDPDDVREGEAIAPLLGVAADGQEDARASFKLDLTCSLDGALMVRAGAQTDADAGHLHTVNAQGERVPVLPGTSLAGALRHRALRIVHTLAPDRRGRELVAAMFGDSPQDDADDRSPTASRLIVEEAAITGAHMLRQTRVAIDRFTGGAYPTALFTEEVLFGGPASRVHVCMALRNPHPHEIGLLLLLLKDLWTGDLPVGGERSVGRGRLRGRKAVLTWPGEPKATWTLARAADGRLAVPEEARAPLAEAVAALNTLLEDEHAEVTDDIA